MWLGAWHPAIAAPGVCPEGFLLDGHGVCARWTAPWGAVLPGARPARVGDEVWLVGGFDLGFEDGPTVHPRVVRIDAGGTATEAPPLAIARQWPHVVGLPSGEALVWGGYDADQAPIMAAERLGPGGSTPFPAPLPSASGVWSDGAVVLVGAEVVAANPADGTVARLAPLRDPREWPGLLALPDGSLLAVGGRRAGTDTPSAAAEILDQKRRWHPAGALATARIHPLLVGLPDGAVVALGGYAGEEPVRAVERWSNGRWQAAGEIPAALGAPLAAIPREGRVWVVGEHGTGWLDPASRRWTDDRAWTGAWADAAPLGDGALVIGAALGRVAPGQVPGVALPRAYDPALASGAGTAWYVGDGQVLRLGGDAQWFPEDPSVARGARVVATDSAVVVYGGRRDERPVSELWIARDGRWTGAEAPVPLDRLPAVATASGRIVFGDGDVLDPLAFAWSRLELRGASAVLVALPDGRVVGIGGAGVVVADPRSGAVSALPPLPRPRDQLAATALADGRVLATGGWADGALRDAWLLEVDRGTWTQTGDMAWARWDHALVTLADGSVLALGGAEHGAELYDPASGAWTPTLSTPSPHSEPRAARLPDGRVVVVERGTEILERVGGSVAVRTLPGGGPDPQGERWWRLEAQARCAMTGTTPCPPLEALAHPPPRQPVDRAAFPERMNPLDPSGAPILRGFATTCIAGDAVVDCPAGMLQREWDACVYGELWAAPSGFDCWCDGRYAQGRTRCPMRSF